MSKANTRLRPKVIQPLVAAVVQPVARRLSRIEALLIEMRHEQDVQLKRSTTLQEQLDRLSDQVKANIASVRRMALHRKKLARPVSE